jgi:hypothetical protein
MVLAGALLVGGLLLFGMRWMQLQTEATSEPVPPPAASESNEPAIVIGGQRVVPGGSASAASSAPKPVVTAVSAPSTKPTASVAAPTHDSDCDNPFVVDSRGIRHPKPQCFKH